MEIVEAREFLKHNHHGVLVARKRDGSLQMTLVSPVVGADGKVTITARETAACNGHGAGVAPPDPWRAGKLGGSP